MSDELNLKKKISVKTVLGNIKDRIPTYVEDGKNPPTYLMRVVGMVTGIKTGNSTYGDWVGYTGSFQATDLATGEIYRGIMLHVPAALDGVLRPVAEKAASEGQTVNVAVDIGAHATKSAVGYEYDVKPLIKMDVAADPLSLLVNEVNEAKPLPQLAAPKTEISKIKK
jgi:hypothetical protein